MSRSMTLDDCSVELIQKLRIPIHENTDEKQTYDACFVENDLVFVPLFLCHTSFPKERDYTKIDVPVFSGELRDYQVEVYAELVQKLKSDRAVLAALYVSFGKTELCLYLFSKLRYRMIVVYPRKEILKGWIARTQRYLNIDATVVTTKTRSLKNVSIALINVTQISKLSPEVLSELQTFGLLVCDEVHMLATPKGFANLLRLTPKYAVALTGTPERDDGMMSAVNLMFGSDYIVRKLYRPHTVYRGIQNITFKKKYQVTGHRDWNKTLNDEALHEGRNLQIAKLAIILVKKGRVVLALCKRVEQAQILYDLTKSEIRSDIYTGKDEEYETNADLLITTYSKFGTGSDNPRLDTLIICGDILARIEQYFGRIIRDRAKYPWVFELISNDSTLKAHWQSRRQVFVELGGKVDDLWKNFDIQRISDKEEVEKIRTVGPLLTATAPRTIIRFST